MIVEHSASLADFVRDVSPFLMHHEAEHGLMLGVAAECDPVPPTAYWAVVRDEDGAIVAAALRTTEKLILSRMEQAGAAALIADSVREHVPKIPGVLGPPNAVAEFADRLGGEWCDGIAHRIYECRRVVPPQGVRGAARLAQRGDSDTIVRWMQDFTREALGKPLASEVAAERAELKSAAGSLYVWDVDGEIVSMAAAVAPTSNAIRIGAVYTPPEQRGHGYASALTAAVTSRQLEMGRTLTFLYTDLANPISNRIYQRIGYVPVADVAMQLRPGVAAI